MTDSVQLIPFANLALAFIPVFVVAGILYKWTADGTHTIYAVFRMLGQLLLIGYFLIFIFESDSIWVVLAVLLVMLCTSTWIALRTIKIHRRRLYKKAFYAIALGGGITLMLITQGVLGLDPWYWPRYLIPLAGMIFANAMNSVSLAAERLFAEMGRDVQYEKARSIAFRASLIPKTTALLAVGLVSLPGMMTGQILSGISPLIAVRYQIMVMCMIFASAGISSACFLKFLDPQFMTPSGEE
jgi:putative ABC transport system permease protein